MLRSTLLTISFLAGPVQADSVLVQSTTSTANSGLYDFLLPQIEADTGLNVNVVAVGTGQAIRNAENCDGDVLLVHARAAEEAFVTRGAGVERFDLMYNDFVLVGPKDDPAGVSGMLFIESALQAVEERKALFASRGDDSGTHKKEMSLWERIDVDPVEASGTWYRETGSGMGATLNTGIGMGAYVLTDRATWVSFGNKQDFVIHVEGDPALFNQYGITLVNPERCPNVRVDAGQSFVDWMLSPTGQAAIAAFRVDGQQLFIPNAGSTE
ncbi:MAG: substrate-binding domain-containing protein [Paracoccaceae bacterium]